MAADSDRWIALVWAIVIHLLLFALITFGLNKSHIATMLPSQPKIIQATAVTEKQVMEPVRRKQEAEKRRVAEKKRKAEERKRKAELKKKRAAEKARRKAEQEKKRKAAEEKKKQKAEEEKKRKQAEEQLKQQMAAEAERLEKENRQVNNKRLQRIQDQYEADIANKVQRNWLRPPDSRGTLCRILIRQIPGGEIVGVKVVDCDGDVSFQRSVEAAVRKSSPLPLPKDDALFQREIEFIFKPVQ